jgi:uncharacterized protein YqeY
MAYTITIAKVKDSPDTRLLKFLQHQLWLINVKREKYQMTDAEIMTEMEQYYKQRVEAIKQYHSEEKQRAVKIREIMKQLDGEATDGV